jgi:O-antigen/teichoic acid export membrane protein
MKRGAYRAYATEFFSYSHPLVAHSLAVLLVAVGDRWLLQQFGGSAEQGFYSLGLRLSSLVFIFTSAMSGLFMREMSLSHGRGDRERMRHLFETFVPMFLFGTTFLAAFVAVHAQSLARLIGGDEFRHAGAAIGVMAFNPVYQTYGQLSGSVLLVTDRTRLFRNINLASMIVGMVLSVLLLAPRRLDGLELGAFGLGLKVLAVDLVIVNIQLWYNARYLGLRYGEHLARQVLVIAGMTAAAWLSAMLGARVAGAPIPALLLSAVLYTMFTASVALLVPSLIGLDRRRLTSHFASIKRFLRP